jgi:glycosyltransferase involved in cell wall biosynthesis
MKVLQVMNSLEVGGAERLVAGFAARLQARGVESTVLALFPKFPVYAEELRASGVRVRFAREGSASLYAPARLADILRVIREERPDIVHAHLWPSIHWCALASTREKGPAYIMTEHAAENRRMAFPLARPWERWCHRRYDRVVCVSEEVAAALEGWLGLSRSRLAVVTNGIDVEHFSNAAKPDADLFAWAAGRRLVVMTARIVPAKDHFTALRALALLPEDYVLAFLGDGPLRPQIEGEVRKLGLSSRCKFLGERSDVSAVLACAQAYVQTSRKEGFGLACLEAMAAGIPVAASDTGGLGPLVRDAGELFPVGDAAACAAALRRVCEDSGVRERAIRAGRNRAREYSIDSVADAYESLYRNVLEERKGPR